MTVAPPSPVSVPVPQRQIGVGATTPMLPEYGDPWIERIERNPALTRPQMYDTYDEMVEGSPQVSSVFQAVLTQILGAQARLDISECKPEIGLHIASDLDVPIVGQDGSIDEEAALGVGGFSLAQHLPIAVDEMLRYGHSFFEQNAVMGPDELWHLNALGWRSGRTLRQLMRNPDGSLRSVQQTPVAGMLLATTAGSTASPVTLSAQRLVVYTRGRKGGNWWGKSLLRAAYSPWFMNNRVARNEMILVDRISTPVPVYTAAQNETDLAAGKKIATQVRSGTSAGAAVPQGAKLDLLGYTGTLPDTDKIKRYNDESIARAVLAHFLNLGASQGTGSYALGSAFSEFFILSLRAIAKSVEQIINEQIIADIVAWNWPGERAPRLVFDEIGANRESMAQVVAELVRFGVLKPDEDLDRFVRIALGLPTGKSGQYDAPADPAGSNTTTDPQETQ